jgi:hypothetical protein
MPDSGGYELISVLVAIDDESDDPLITIAEYSHKDKCFLDPDSLRQIGSNRCYTGTTVTHWMPLPKPPTEEATNDQAKE